MKIQEKDRIHGAALTQIVEHPSFKALNKADSKYGHYQINNNIRLLMRHRSDFDGPWSFTFTEEDVNTLINDISKDNKSFLCLICGKKYICLLSSSDYEKLFDRLLNKPQSIIIDCPPNSSLHVRNKTKTLSHTIPHNDFPNKLFEH